jgi:flagellar hook protein FlgE
VAAQITITSTNVYVGSPTGYGFYGPPDCSIMGPGFFVVKDTFTGQAQATRYGAFWLDSNGYLVTSTGLRVQGFSDAELTTIGDIKIDATGAPAGSVPSAPFVNYSIQTNGSIVVTLADGTTFVRGQILLQNFQYPSALTRVGDRLFTWSNNDGPLAQPVTPGTSGTGWLQSGELEELLPKLQLGVYTGPPKTFSQGMLVPTGNSSDLGIEGNGFFILRRTNDNALFATRAGTFYLGDDGYMEHYSGLRLQGYNDGTLTTIGDIQVNSVGAPPDGTQGEMRMVYYFVDRFGQVIVTMPDGSQFVRGQILLQACTNTDVLSRGSFDLYPIQTNSDLWLQPAGPSSPGLGWIVGSSLEAGQLDTNLLAVRGNLNFFVQGNISPANSPTCLAINGNGFFNVRDPSSNIFYATRSGNFQLDASNHLVTTNGFRVQGFNTTGLMQIGDITMDTAGAPNPSLSLFSFNMNAQGNIIVTLSDGTTFVRGQILLQNYVSLQELKPAGNGLYTNLSAAEPLPSLSPPDTQGLGNIQSMALEMPPPQPTPIQLPPASGFRLFIDDLSGGGTVQASPDMVHWTTIGQVAGSDLDQAEFFDAEQAAQKFYRVVVQY